MTLFMLFSIYSIGQHTELLKSKGIELINNGNYYKALPYLKEAIKIDSSIADLHFYYALSLMKVHDYNQSIKEFKKVISLDPKGLNHPNAS